MRASAEPRAQSRGRRGAQCASLWAVATALVCHVIAGDGLRAGPKVAARQQRPPPTAHSTNRSVLFARLQ